MIDQQQIFSFLSICPHYQLAQSELGGAERYLQLEGMLSVVVEVKHAQIIGLSIHVGQQTLLIV
jgi:hypothetical protein